MVKMKFNYNDFTKYHELDDKVNAVNNNLKCVLIDNTVGFQLGWMSKEKAASVLEKISNHDKHVDYLMKLKRHDMLRRAMFVSMVYNLNDLSEHHELTHVKIKAICNQLRNI